MASPLVPRTPQCLSCIHRITGSLGDVFQVPGHQQIRGKKRLAKVSTVKVHLLQNVPGYGRRGAVVPVTSGMMRNIWYPKKMAEYVTTTKLQQLGLKKDALVERDSTFRSNAERKLEKEREKLEREDADAASAAATLAVKQEPAFPIELDLLSPERSVAILEELIPPSLDFYRTPITTAHPTPKRVSPSIPVTSVISSAAAEGKETETTGETSIYGSVSTADIAANLKAILAEDEDGVRVVLSPEEISFVDETDDKGRVKHLGIFEIEIKLNGAPNPIRRTVQVHAQE